MSHYSITLILFIFLYFLTNAVVLFFQGELWSGLCCLTFAIGLPYLIVAKDNYIEIGFVLLIFSISGAFSTHLENTKKPEHQYFEYVSETLRGGYFGDHESEVRLACGIQLNVNLMSLIGDLFKAVYYDVFLSAIDFIIKKMSDPVKNRCLIAVEELRKEYPEFKAIPIK